LRLPRRRTHASRAAGRLFVQLRCYTVQRRVCTRRGVSTSLRDYLPTHLPGVLCCRCRLPLPYRSAPSAVSWTVGWFGFLFTAAFTVFVLFSSFVIHRAPRAVLRLGSHRAARFATGRRQRRISADVAASIFNSVVTGACNSASGRPCADHSTHCCAWQRAARAWLHALLRIPALCLSDSGALPRLACYGIPFFIKHAPPYTWLTMLALLLLSAARASLPALAARLIYRRF